MASPGRWGVRLAVAAVSLVLVLALVAHLWLGGIVSAVVQQVVMPLVGILLDRL